MCVTEECRDTRDTSQRPFNSLNSLIPITIALATLNGIVQPLTNDQSQIGRESVPPAKPPLEGIGVLLMKMVHEQGGEQRGSSITSLAKLASYTLSALSSRQDSLPYLREFGYSVPHLDDRC
jgi:hypothetical protein